MRMKKKNKTKKARAKRARLYIEEESKKTRSIVITEQNIDETQRVVSKS
jgi:IS5 family transposase